MPTFVQISYALAVERFRHFGKAAKACHVSQPTLSQQLQKLEDELAIILFDRLKKPILPTPEGRLFLDQAQVVLREQEKLLQVVKQSQKGEVSGDFRLGVIPTVASDLLPLFLSPFAQAFPHVQLLIEEMKTELILQELLADRLDGAILATPIEGESFKVRPLYYEPFFIYFSPQHPLLSKSVIGKADLDASQLWQLQDGHCFKDQVASFCSLSGSREVSSGSVRFQSGSLDTLRRLVQRSYGYTLIPSLMALSLRKSERDAQVRSFESPVPAREISLIYRRDHWKLAILGAIERALKTSLPASIPQLPGKSMHVMDWCRVK